MKRILLSLVLAAAWLPAQEPPTTPLPVPARTVRTNAPAAAAAPAPAAITNIPGVRLLPAAPAAPTPANRPAAAVFPDFPRPVDMTRFKGLEGTNLINALWASGHTNLAVSQVKRQGLTNYVYGPPPAGFDAAAKTNAPANPTPTATAAAAAAGAGPGRSATAIFGTNTAPAAAAGTNPTAAGGDEEIAPGVIRLQAADLTAVLDLYAELVQRTILRPAALPDAKITLRNQSPLSRAEAIRALEAVLNMNGVTLINVGEKFVKVVGEPDASKQGKEVTSIADVAEMPALSGFVTVVRQMTNAKPSEVTAAIQPFAKMAGGITAIDSSGMLVIRDYADQVKRMMEMIDKIDVSIPMDVEPVVIPIKYALAGDIAQVLGQLTSGGSVSTTGSSGASRGGLTGGGSRSGLGSRGGYGSSGYGSSPYGGGMNNPYGGTATPYGSATGTGGITPSINPGTASSQFADRLRSIVSKAAGTGDIMVLGQAKIIADERINALLVFADKRDRDMITNIISKLDVVLAQVLIEALIVEVSLSDSENHGISYLQNAASKGKLTGAGGVNNGQTLADPYSVGSLGTNLTSGFSYFGKWGGDLDIAATAYAQDSRATVLSRPRIQTSHAVQANIFVGETRPYPTGSSYGYGSSYSTIQQTRIGIELSVLPLINQDGLVVMEIQQNIQNVGTSVKIDNNEVPSTVDRSASAKVAVKDKETIILGGFISSDTSKIKAGVPLLKDIPGLGVLFRSSSQSHNRKELVVFIRPTVLPTPDAASAWAAKERETASPVYQTEQEFKADEAKRSETIKRQMSGEKAPKKPKAGKPAPSQPADDQFVP
jgi:general secretion pathway protein D